MIELPIMIGNEYCSFPKVQTTPLEMRLSTNIGNFQGLEEFIDIMKEIKVIFKSRFSFMQFLLFLNRKDCTSLNNIEIAIVHLLISGRLSSFLADEDSEGETYKEPEERISAAEIESLKTALISVFYNVHKTNNKNISFQSPYSHIPYINLYRVFEEYFITEKNKNNILRIMWDEQLIKAIQYTFSEEDTTKAGLLFTLLSIKPEDIMENIPDLKDLFKLKVEIINEEFGNDDYPIEEIAKNIEDGDYDFFEAEMMERSNKKIVSQMKKFIINEYENLLKENEIIKNNLLKTQEVKKAWSDTRNKTIYREKPFNTNVYTWVFKSDVKPVIYVLDEIIYSINIGSYVAKTHKKGVCIAKLEEQIYKVREQIKSLLKIDCFLLKDQPLSIKIFDKDGQVYHTFDDRRSFLESFVENNNALETYYNRIKENKKIVNLLFTRGEFYTADEIDVIINFSKKLFDYLRKNRDKSRLLSFPSLDLNINTSAIINLFESLLGRREDISKKYANYYVLIEMFFIVLLKIYTQGKEWFKLTGTKFSEIEYIGDIVQILVDSIGLEEVLKVIISIVQIKTRVKDKLVIKNVYIDNYSFLFNKLETPDKDIVDIIYNLYKGLRQC